MDRKMVVVLLISVMVLTSAITILVLLQPSEVRSVPITLAVSDVMGFNLDTDGLYFSSVLPGSSVRKTINISNTVESTVFMYVTGDVERFIHLSESRFTLEPDVERLVVVEASIPKDAEFGNYSGDLVMEFR